MPGNSVFSSSNHLWGASVVGIGSPQFLSTFVVWGLIGQLLAFVGISGPLAQFLFLTTLLLWQGYGLFTFVDNIFPEYPIGALITSLSLPLSLYNILIFRNPIQAFALGYFAWFAGTIWHLIAAPMAQWRRGIIGGLATIGLAILAGTPPLALTFSLWALFWVVLAWRAFHQFRQTYPSVILALMVSGVLNEWWIIAAYFALFDSQGSLQQTFQGPLAWDWVDQHASILHLLSMQGFWSYPQRAYFPWITWYHTALYHWSLFLPMVLALLGLIWGRSKRAVSLLGIIIVALYIAKGVHRPFAISNIFLYLHLPSFWLLRDPQVEMDPILYIALFTLVGMGVSAFVARVYHGLPRVLRPMAFVIASLLVFGLGLNGAPLLNGSAFRAVTAQHVRSTVTIPASWNHLAAFLRRQGGHRGVIALPNDDFYQMPYSWGYYGTDQVAQTLLSQPVTILSPVPSGYFAGSPPYQRLLARIQTDIQFNPTRPIAPLLQSLGIRWVIQRNDIRSNFPHRKILSPTYMQYYYGQQKDLKLTKTWGKLALYRVKSSSPSPTFAGYRTATWWSSPNNPSFITAHQVFNHTPAWITSARPSTIPVSAVGHRWSAFHTQSTIAAKTHGTMTIRPKELRVVARRTAHAVTIILTGPSFQSGHRAPHTWTTQHTIPLTKTLAANRPLVVQIGGKHFVIPPSPSPQRHRLGSMGVPSGTTFFPIEVWSEKSARSIHWSHALNCNRQGSSGTIHAAHAQGNVTISGHHAGACVNNSQRLSIPHPAREQVWLNIGYRHRRGTAPNYAIAQNARVTHIQLPSHTTWQHWSQWINPTAHTIRVFAYAYSVHHPTTNQYHATVTVLAPVSRRTLVPIHSERFAVHKGSVHRPSGIPTTHTVWAARMFTHGPHIIFNAHNTSPATAHSLSARALSATTFALTAQTDAVGYQTTITHGGGRFLRITGQAQVTQGLSSPRVTITDNQGHIVWNGRFFAGRHAWQPFSKNLYIPVHDYPIRLTFYSYASYSTPTTVRYKNVALQEWSHQTGQLTWLSGKSPRHTSVRAIQQHSTQDRVLVSPRTRLLVMHGAYSPLWHATVANHPHLKLKHVSINHMLNGWIIPPHRRALTISIVFSPQTLYSAVFLLTIIVILVLAIIVVFPMTAVKKLTFYRKYFKTDQHSR